MVENFGDGFNKRFPGKKGSRVPRVGLTAIGPFHEVSADGHEKIGAQALQMGTIGLPIYGYKDKWSDCILVLRVVPNARTAAAGGHLLLDLIEALGCELQLVLLL